MFEDVARMEKRAKLVSPVISNGITQDLCGSQTQTNGAVHSVLCYMQENHKKGR